MSAVWFSRWWKQPARPVRPATRRRARLAVEALEERMLMNNRFVVPGIADNVTTFGTLHAALTMPGLNAGDVIQIEPNSSPGPVHNADIPAVKNLTIQGNSAFDVQSIPFFSLADFVSIGPTRQGFTLKNVQVDIQVASLQFTADGTITGCRIKDDFAGTALELAGTSAAVISDSYIESANPQSVHNVLLSVSSANGSHNRITDNQFVALTGTNITLLAFDGTGAGSTDVVAHNTFLGNTGTSPLFEVAGGTQGLTIQGNTFTDGSDSGIAIEVVPDVQNLQIVDNVISIASVTFAQGIWVTAGTSTAPSSMVIASNHINAGGHGIGIEFWAQAPGVTFVAKVENNDLEGNQNGVVINQGKLGSVAGIDLGGGAQGSLGANNFRGDPAAIYDYALMAAGPIQAQMNIFGVADPKTVIYDHNNEPTLAAVVATSPLTGNAAYVETLYLDFLHRTGDLSNPNDAGSWVTLLGQGMPSTAVASGVTRSTEGLGVAVDGLYHRFLGRDADPAGRAGFVSYLQAGGTLEGVSRAMLASPEYQSRFPTDSSFVQSLYQNLLQRTGSTAEVGGWLAPLPQLGRAGVAQGFLSSQEYRDLEVVDDYTQLLDRTQPPSAAEVNGWVGTGLDILSIDTLIAALAEFQLNG